MMKIPHLAKRLRKNKHWSINTSMPWDWTIWLIVDAVLLIGVTLFIVGCFFRHTYKVQKQIVSEKKEENKI